MLLSKAQKLWNSWEQKWELRTLVLISLFIQMLLVLFGSRRKFVVNKLVTLLLWMGYLLADNVATLALGVVANNEGIELNHLQAFWSPFLLLHLGGPDSITAFSLEDNELWLRHFLGLSVQVGVVLYIFITILWASKLWLVSILMFIAGIIKYSERTWALKLASRENFRESMVTDPDPGPDYAKFIEEYSSRKKAGLNAKIEWVTDLESQLVLDPRYDYGEERKIINYENLISKAQSFFQIFRRLITDLILTFNDRNESQYFFLNLPWELAYKVIEIELEFLYEVLYTKAAVTRTITGCILRIITVTSIISAFIIFSLFIDSKSKYRKIDVVITYVLLGGAISLELWSLTRLVFSEWTIVWLKKNHFHLNVNQLSTLLFEVVSYFRPFYQPRWSNSMAQYNLIEFCIKDQPSMGRRIMKLVHVKDSYDKFRYTKHIHVREELKQSIFEYLKETIFDAIDSNTSYYKYFSTCRGELALRTIAKDDIIHWSIKAEIDESILLWHIATDICFSLDPERDLETIVSKYQKNSRAVSNYMLYLLVSRPFMLTAGIGQIRFGDTCAEAKNFFHQRGIKMDEKQACNKLFEVDTEVAPKEVKVDRSKSVLFDASRLAKSLHKLDTEKRWEIISFVWFEILYYTAGHCKGNYHAQRLSHGGELLTFVWFLMVHFGIGEQYRAVSGRAQAKLIVEM